MKVKLLPDENLLIEPETEFEADWLQDFNIDLVFKKYGMTNTDFLGIKIVNKPIKKEGETL